MREEHPADGPGGRDPREGADPLSDPELQRERGEEPPDPVGGLPAPEPGGEPDPGYVPDPADADEWRRLGAEIAGDRRPRREDVYPYLLVRAFAPGDRGRRPVWPPTVCWESPDVLLMDASDTGPFDPTRLVVSPVAGRSYRVFVRIWNLGLLPAVGVFVQAWAIPPGFIGAGNQDDPYYEKSRIGDAWVEELGDRRSPACTTVVELGRPWEIAPGDTGHECLIASVTCPADHFTGPLLVNHARHVGQRNVWVTAPHDDLTSFLGLLGRLVPRGATLELTHGGPAALPLLTALTGGRPESGDLRREIVVPELAEVRHGVDTGAFVHLLTAFEDEGRTVAARSDALQELAGRTRHGRAALGHPFAEAGATRRLLERLGPDAWDRVGLVADGELSEVWLDGLRRLLDVGELTSRGLAASLGGAPDAVHLLRLTATERDGTLIGGYSIGVMAE